MSSSTVTAKARELAAELGVDVEEIEGSGKGGKVTVEDVKLADRSMRLGERPADLEGRSIRVWNEVKSYLESNDLWQPIFGDLLGLYVRSLETADRARREIRVEGEVTTGSQGQDVMSPHVKIKRDAEQDALKYAQALLITPEAHQRHTGGTPEIPEGDPDDDLGF